MYEQPRKPLTNPPVPDIENLSSATEYTGLVPAAVPFEEEENELRPFGETHFPLPGEPSDGPEQNKN